jgi:uncharacterized protein (TIGR02246 family)
MRKLTQVLPVAGLALILLAGSSLGQTPGSQASEAEKAVLAALAKIKQAAETLQASSLSELVLPQATVIQNGTLFRSRDEFQQAIDAAYKNLEKQEINFRRQQVTMVAPTVALVTAEAEGTSTLAGGTIVSGTSAWTVLFVLTDNQWKVLHAHTSVPRR